MKVFAAIPCYDGRVCVETARALLDEQAVAAGAGVELRAAFLPGCSLITLARNQLVGDFLTSDCDRLVFVDSDVSWEPGSLIRIASHPVEFVGGAYRLKQEPEGYPVGWDDSKPELWSSALGLIEVASVPGGFLSLGREVFDKLRSAYPDRAFTHYDFSGHAFFHAPVRDGRLYGEDTAFCADWRTIGGQVWLDPNLTLTHIGGANRYKGHVGDWLKNRPMAEAA